MIKEKAESQNNEEEKQLFNRPYTCIFSIANGTSSACIVNAPDGADRALEAAKQALPEAVAIHAMIPGVHDGHTYTYQSKSKKQYVSKQGGPWPENLPPGF